MRPCDLNPRDLIHPYWIEKYHLDSLEGEVKTVPARSLLGPWRFGFFSKMVYIRYRKTRPCLARRVYYESLRCTTPFMKEPGKEEEKYNFRVFIHDFNQLIDRLSSEAFDPGESIVPVGFGRHIIDGEHRVSTLSYFDKDVTIYVFPAADLNCLDYEFYKDRWMSDYCMDLAASECVAFLKGLRVLCLWPGADADLSCLGEVVYSRSFKTGHKAYSKLRFEIDSLWSGKSVKGETRFVYYLPSGINHAPDVSGDSMVISDPEEVLRVSNLVLTWKGRLRWYLGGRILCRPLAFMDMFWDKLRADYRFVRFRIKFVLGNWDNKLWISFYNFVSPLWKRYDNITS